MIRSLLFVGVGGFVGSILRLTCTQAIAKYYPSSLPIGTLSVNIIGCLVLGLLFHTSFKWDRDFFLLFTTGICGGFTTFSTFSIENIALLQAQQYTTAISYILLSLVFGLLAGMAGWYIGKIMMG